MTSAPPASRDDAASPAARRRGRRVLGTLAGLLAAAAGLGAAELVAGIVGTAGSPVLAVGNAAIALTPEPVKAFAIATFGTDDKTALVVGTLILLALYAAAIGVLSLRNRPLGVLGIALFGGVGAVAAITRPAAGALDWVPSVVGAAAAVAALNKLLAPLTPSAPEPAGERAGIDRRQFFLVSGAAAGLAVIAGGSGLLLRRRFDVTSDRSALRLPTPASPGPALPASADLSAGVPGLTPLITANRDFYRIDTALTVPQIRVADYRLRFTGMFDSPRSYTLADLINRHDVLERDLTIACVSNEVGGTLAGTARWLGVPLAALLRENGVRATSTQLVCRSVDGMTIGAPTRSALDVPGAMLAFGMNGEPLPIQHGFPVRMLIPGLYGYVSACKWLTSIEATTFEAFSAYWVQGAWAPEAPIKVESRIDTPAADTRFAAGVRPIAGVAWAPTRGIGKVEVQVDGGPWTSARLSPEVDGDIWRQWVLPYDFRPGTHRVTVRATTADGELQTQARAAPFPNGATGWHSIVVFAS